MEEVCFLGGKALVHSKGIEKKERELMIPQATENISIYYYIHCNKLEPSIQYFVKI